MDWKFEQNSEGEGFQYLIMVDELDKDIFSVEKLIEEVEDLVGEDNVQELQTGYFAVECINQQQIDLVDEICRKYDDIFQEEEDEYLGEEFEPDYDYEEELEL